MLVTGLGLPNWQAVAPFDWFLIGGYAATAVVSNWLMLKTYEAAEASAVQPFAYLHIVFASIIALVVFGEHLAPAVALGAAIVVASGVFALISKGNRPMAEQNSRLGIILMVLTTLVFAVQDGVSRHLGTNTASIWW